MIVGLLADSHDNVPQLREAVTALADEGAECLLHAGDFIAPFAVRELVEFPGKVMAVFGNNDGERAGIKKVLPDVFEAPHLFELGGRRILVTHDLALVAEDQRAHADVVVYGHTHQVDITRGKPLVLNPGECGGWLSGKSTAMILETAVLEPRVLTIP